MNKIISFGLCPFVQRSLITMNYKNVPYDVEYIDLENKPEWFLKLSPLGKVPVLQVEDTVLFESAVINEYIDETTEGSLLPTDSLAKAKDRAYIEMASVIIMNYFVTAIAKDEDTYTKNKATLEKNLSTFLTEYEGPYFRGETFSLVDTSAIPALQRILKTNNLRADLKLSDEISKKFDQWAEATLNMPAVLKSVPETFDADYDAYLTKRESYIHLKK